MTWNRRRFLATSGAAAVGSLAAATSARPAAPASRSASLFLTEDDGLKPATMDRLPLEWHQARLKALQGKLQEDGYAGILLGDPMNIIYFTGLFFTSTERPFRVYLPADKLATIWFNPGIDRDSVKSWWATEEEFYFDFPHAEGGFPNEGKVQQGANVDIFEWTLQELKKRGLDGKKIATDWELSRGQLAAAGKVFVKDTKIDSVAIC
jgi:Xaa-Pro aminopeptidase